MAHKRTENLYRRERGPTIGCADVTIVSIAAITAFVILILILSRADFASVVENFDKGNTAVAAAPAVTATPTIDKTATIRALAALTPTITPSPIPTATPAPKRAVLKTTCNLRPQPSVNQGTKGEFRTGAPFIILSNRKEAEGIRWVNVQVDDGSNTTGWMWEICFDASALT